MRLELLRLLTALTLLTIWGGGWAPALGTATTPNDYRFLNFRQRMMPRVGTRIMVSGRLTSGKLGYWVGFGGWGAYIYAVHNADLDRLNGLSAMLNHEVQIKGTLRHRSASTSANDSVASVPEHFYFDIAETSIVMPPAHPPKNPATTSTFTRIAGPAAFF